MQGGTLTLWSDDGNDVTFARAGVDRRAERFVERLRAKHPLYAEEKLPADRRGLDAVANAQWLSREEYQGPLRDSAFRALEKAHFVQDLSSGTTGQPVLRFQSWSDELSEQLVTKQVFGLVGMGPGDRVVCLEIGAPEISAFYFRAMAEIGVRDRAYLHVSTDFDGSIDPLEALDPTVILTVPGVLARCGPRFFRMYDGRRPRALRAVVHYAEPLSRSLRSRLDSVGVESFSFYGTTEVGGVAGECARHDGLHVMDDCVLPTLRHVEQVGEGRFRGEIGWTTLHFEAQPLLKYAVGDVVEIDTVPCPCGFPGVRMRFVRRTHDLVCVYGLKFGFEAIEAALARALGTEDPLVHIELADAPKGMAMTVRVCRDHAVDPAAINAALYSVFEVDEMLDMGYLTVEVEVVDRAFFDQRKLRRVVDRRSDAPFAVEET